ncbi:MAG TPA: glycosyltransferase family 1 protein, partial [Candidatus Methylomirabilis sp.]|nr:glycosyltransferase family 1 protein [Candidatus Methylomirabilis sp.]
LMVRTYPQALPLKARVYSRFMTPLYVAAADRIITVSRFNEREILRYYPRASGKITVIPNGIHLAFAPRHDPEHLRRIREREKIPARYFLYVGSLRKYKNLHRLLKAFSLLPGALRTTVSLVVAARVEPQFSGILQAARDLGLHEEVRFVGHLPPEELAPLYSGAIAFITVSLYESFCYPAVEAMACGTPVIAPDRLALPEITQGAALLVNPLDPTAIREAMERLADDEAMRQRLIEDGLRRARDFTCQAMAEQVAKAHHEVLSR